MVKVEKLNKNLISHRQKELRDMATEHNTYVMLQQERTWVGAIFL